MYSHNHRFLFFLFCSFFCSYLFSQSIKIDLPDRTTLDDDQFHIELFSRQPNENLILPQIELVNAWYFHLFNSWNIKNDQTISAIVFPSDTGDILYVDLNNDEDMTNDGQPLFFLRSQNDIMFTILNTSDTNQIVKLMVMRKPTLPDTSMAKYVDPEGNLNPKFAVFYGALPGHTEITGKQGTYYFDDRVSLRSGNIQIQNQRFRIGIFDYDNNGIFNDSNDVLIVDLNQDKKLCYSDYSEVFQLNDLFTINNTNYKLSSIDPYGLQVTLVTTNERPQHLFLKKQQSTTAGSYDTGIIDSTFWDQKIRSVDGKIIRLQQYKGKYLLLNFWGEWCGPCVAEIPILVEAYQQYSKKNFDIIGFLQPSDLRKAKKMIVSKNMKWKQSVVSEKLIKKFAIKAFPTNILIFPDGKKFVRTNSIFDVTFFEQQIH